MNFGINMTIAESMEAGRSTGLVSNSWVLLKRQLRLSLRSPDAIITAILVPVTIMVLLGLVFGGITEMGAADFVNFIVPAIILISIITGSAITAVSMNNDAKKGIVDRLKSMPVSRAAVLISHALAAVLRTLTSTAATLLAALAIGFRPEASFGQWVAALGFLLLFIWALTWAAIWLGLRAANAESAGGIFNLLAILPYFSSGFAPVDTMPRALELFATYQPMTPIIDTLRGLFMNLPLNNEPYIALAWLTVVSIVAFMASIRTFNRRIV